METTSPALSGNGKEALAALVSEAAKAAASRVGFMERNPCVMLCNQDCLTA
jgi:hypothetical protein